MNSGSATTKGTPRARGLGPRFISASGGKIEEHHRVASGRSGNPRMTLIKIVACAVWLLLGSSALAGEPAPPTAPPRTPLLELPRLTDLELPTIGPPLVQPQIATGFFGCWMGTPREFDAVLPAPAVGSLYRLRHVTKCYLPGRIETREFAVELTPKHRILDAVLSFLSLGSHGAEVERETTDVYGITANQIYSRGTLTLELTAGSLFEFPHPTRETIVDEEIATLIDPDNVSIVGRAFLTGPGARSVGTWHADFHH